MTVGVSSSCGGGGILCRVSAYQNTENIGIYEANRSSFVFGHACTHRSGREGNSMGLLGSETVEGVCKSQRFRPNWESSQRNRRMYVDWKTMT